MKSITQFLKILIVVFCLSSCLDDIKDELKESSEFEDTQVLTDGASITYKIQKDATVVLKVTTDSSDGFDLYFNGVKQGGGTLRSYQQSESFSQGDLIKIENPTTFGLGSSITVSITMTSTIGGVFSGGGSKSDGSSGGGSSSGDSSGGGSSSGGSSGGSSKTYQLLETAIIGADDKVYFIAKKSGTASFKIETSGEVDLYRTRTDTGSIFGSKETFLSSEEYEENVDLGKVIRINNPSSISSKTIKFYKNSGEDYFFKSSSVKEYRKRVEDKASINISIKSFGTYDIIAFKSGGSDVSLTIDSKGKTFQSIHTETLLANDRVRVYNDGFFAGGDASYITVVVE